MKKYKLPEVEQLKKIGFKFEFYPMKEFHGYAKKFVIENDDELFKILIPDFDVERYEWTVEEESCPEYEIEKADERIKRLKSGDIETTDYRFVVHPVHKNSCKVLINAWEKRKARFGIDSQQLLFYPKTFGVTPLEAIHTTLQNELYRIIIQQIPFDFFEAPPKDEFKSYKDQMDRLYDRYDLSNLKHGSLRYNFRKQILYNSLEGVKNSLYDEIFARSLSVVQRVSRLFPKIKIPTRHFEKMSSTTSIEDKEMVIRQYFKSQSSAVQKSRNTRGKGIHKANRKRIVEYFEENPGSSISSAANALGLDRKTVRKHKP